MPEKNKRIDLNDRETITIGIVRKQPLKKIARLLGRHVTSISNEIREHRIFVSGSYYAGNDCRYAKGCDKRHVCGDEDCPMFCYACHKDCHQYCPEYATKKCRKYDSPFALMTLFSFSLIKIPLLHSIRGMCSFLYLHW